MGEKLLQYNKTRDYIMVKKKVAILHHPIRPKEKTIYPIL